MRTHLPLPAFALSLLAASLTACFGPGPITGGPCAYETSVVEGTAKEVDTDGVLFEGEEGEFWVPAEYLPDLPAVGETLTLERDRITEGTCTPEIYLVLDLSEEDTEAE